MKILLGLVIGIVAIVLVIVLVAGYFGFVPGVSNLFGSNKPKNLGTTFTAQDYKSAISKTGVQFLNNTDTVSLDKSQKTYGPAKAVSFDLTPAETLALLNDKAHGPDFPISDWQLRVNPDGTAEISAVLNIADLDKYAAANGATSEGSQQLLDAVKKAGVITKEVSFYMKGDAAVTNGQLSFETTSFKIGNLSISADTVNSNKSNIVDYFNTHKNVVPGFTIKNLSIVNGKIHFDGTVPSTINTK
jgi:hypothetical protein